MVPNLGERRLCNWWRRACEGRIDADPAGERLSDGGDRGGRREQVAAGRRLTGFPAAATAGDDSANTHGFRRSRRWRGTPYGHTIHV